MNHIAKQIEHIVLKGDTWQLLDLGYGTHLTTSKPFDVYTDRQEAIDAIKAHDPSFEPSEWTPPVVPSEVRIGHLLVALLDHDEAKYDQMQSAIESDKRLRAAIQDPYVSRTSVLLAQMAQLLELDDATVDQLFIQAHGIKL